MLHWPEKPLSLCERRDAPLFTAPTVSLAELLGGKRPRIEGRTAARLDDYVAEIVRGGFPGIRTLPARTHRAALAGYVTRIVEREFPEADGDIRNPGALRRWTLACGAATASAAVVGQYGPKVVPAQVPWGRTLPAAVSTIVTVALPINDGNRSSMPSSWP